MGFLTRYDGELREPFVRCQGSQVSMRVATGSASLLLSYGRGIRPQDASKKDSPVFLRLRQETLGSLDLCWRSQGACKGASEKLVTRWGGRGLSGLQWFWCYGRGPHLELRQEPKGSSPFLIRIAGSLQIWDRTVRPRLVWRNGTHLASRVVHGVTGHVSSCVWNL